MQPAYSSGNWSSKLMTSSPQQRPTRDRTSPRDRQSDGQAL